MSFYLALEILLGQLLRFLSQRALGGVRRAGWNGVDFSHSAAGRRKVIRFPIRLTQSKKSDNLIF
jgi:hypothetical protein